MKKEIKHEFYRYYFATQKVKKSILKKYLPVCQEIFLETARLIELVCDTGASKETLTESEVRISGEILSEMYAAEPEDEIESMVTACKKLTALKIRIWKRQLKHNEKVKKLESESAAALSDSMTSLTI